MPVHGDSIGVQAASDPKLRRVLEHLGVDYVCCGDQTLTEACASAGLSAVEVERDYERESALLARRAKSSGSSLTSLLQYLKEQHREITRAWLWPTSMLLQTLPDREVRKQPCYRAIRTHFAGLVQKIAAHIEREERVFQLIAAIESAWIHGTEPPRQREGGLHRDMATIGLQHAGLNDDLKTLRRERAAIDCRAGHPECRRLIEQLASLEEHLHELMNLEEFVLYPAATSMEDELFQSNEAAVV